MMFEPIVGLNIRPMLDEDVPSVHELDTLSFTLPWSERSLSYEVNQNAGARTWVAEIERNDGRKIVGMLILWLILDEAHIATLAVHPDFRRKGIARKIMITALNAAFQEGARSSYLEVRAGNHAALQMYKEMGYKVMGRRSHYYHDNQEDALLLTLEELHLFKLEHGRLHES
jgi:[ribosomal protein S18]-alanine N-acetyltransferase